MRVATEQSPQFATGSSRVFRNNRQQAKISWKRKQSLEMATAIREFLDDNDIPLMKIAQEEYAEFQELLTFYFKLLKSNKSIYAVFTGEGGQKKVQQVAMMYSMHRLCPVWNFRKAQLIGGIYRNFLSTKTLGVDKNGDLQYLIKQKTGVHIVLTMPHKDGMYQGKKFYARDILKAFHELRRCAFFKNATYGGEYGLEIKKGKAGNGLHIHLHSLCFLNEGVSVVNFRAWLKKKWKELTGATHVHAGKLFYHKRDASGQWIMDHRSNIQKVVEHEDGCFEVQTEETIQKKRFYCDGNTPVEEYTSAILECIKYHFKGDEMVMENGQYDVPLMHEILSNSRGLRFYSRYGAFYREPELNFDALKNAPGINATDELEDDQIEETLKGSAENAMRMLANPFTGEDAAPGSYRICLCNPENLRYTGRSALDPYSLTNYSERYFLPIQPDVGVKEIIKAISNHELSRIIDWSNEKRKIFN